MPVTAKFSEKFYQTLGHWCNRVDATYRSKRYRRAPWRPKTYGTIR